MAKRERVGVKRITGKNGSESGGINPHYVLNLADLRQPCWHVHSLDAAIIYLVRARTIALSRVKALNKFVVSLA